MSSAYAVRTASSGAASTASPLSSLPPMLISALANMPGFSSPWALVTSMRMLLLK